MKETRNSTEAPADGEKRLTTKLLVGGGLVGAATIAPKKWAKPVINVAVLPAHAETTRVKGS